MAKGSDDKTSDNAIKLVGGRLDDGGIIDGKQCTAPDSKE